LGGQAERFLNGKGTTLQPLLQRSARVVGHRDEQLPVIALLDGVNAADVGMVQSRRGPRLTEEALLRDVVMAPFRRQELEGHAAVEVRIVGLVDHTHPAATHLGENPVVRNGLPNHSALT